MSLIIIHKLNCTNWALSSNLFLQGISKISYFLSIESFKHLRTICRKEVVCESLEVPREHRYHILLLKFILKCQCLEHIPPNIFHLNNFKMPTYSIFKLLNVFLEAKVCKNKDTIIFESSCNTLEKGIHIWVAVRAFNIHYYVYCTRFKKITEILAVTLDKAHIAFRLDILLCKAIATKVYMLIANVYTNS